MGATSRAATLLWALALVAGPALASSVTGGFQLNGPLTMPADSDIRMVDALALYADETRDATFTLHASTLRVHAFERHSVGPSSVSLTPIPPEERTWTLTDVTIDLASGGDHRGFAGIYPGPSASAGFVPASTADIEAEHVSGVPRDKTRTNDGPDTPFYSVKIERPHLFVDSPGSLHFSGAGAIKITGFDLSVRASENTTAWQTGFFQTTPVEQTTRWLYLEFDQATIVLSSPRDPLELAASSAAVQWDGEAQMNPTSGGLDAPEGAYDATGEPTRLDGAFSAALAPDPTSPGAMTLSGLSGELRATTLRHQPLPAPGPLGGWPSWVGLLAVGLTIAGGAVAVLWGRERAMPRRSGVKAAVHARRAMEAADRHDWEEAQALFAKAARLDPARAGPLLCERGVALFAMERWADALDAFEAASARTDDGEADLWAARCLLQMGHEDHAETSLLRALDRSRLDLEVLRQVSSEDEFEALRLRPSVDQALDAALARRGLAPSVF